MLFCSLVFSESSNKIKTFKCYAEFVNPDEAPRAWQTKKREDGCFLTLVVLNPVLN